MICRLRRVYQKQLAFPGTTSVGRLDRDLPVIGRVRHARDGRAWVCRVMGICPYSGHTVAWPGG
jgi:hypothetical protein